MKLKLKEYKIKDLVKGVEQVINLEAESAVPANYAEELAINLASLNSLSNNLNFDSLITFELIDATGINKVEVEKNNSKKTLQTSLNGQSLEKDIYAYLAEKSGVGINQEAWKLRVIDLVSLKTISLSAFKDRLASANTYLKIDRINNSVEAVLNSQSNVPRSSNASEVDERIRKIQEELDFYQNEKKIRNDINSKIQKIDQERDQSKQIFESVKLLLETRDKLSKELGKFSTIANDSSLESRVASLKTSRVQKTYTNLSKIRTRTGNLSNTLKISTDRVIIAKSLILLVVLQIFITILLYILSGENLILGLGFLSTLILSTSFGGINLFHDNLLLLKGISKKAHTGVGYENVVPSNPREDNFLVNAAWVSALKNELMDTEKEIQARLNGKSSEKFEEELKAFDTQKEDLNKELGELDKKTITSEEYYKKRREVEILKIEKENLEYTDNKPEVSPTKSGPPRAENQKSEAGSQPDQVGSTLGGKPEVPESDSREFIDTLPFVFVGVNFVTEEIKKDILGLRVQRQVVVVNVM